MGSTRLTGPVFHHTLQELRTCEVFTAEGLPSGEHISPLDEILDALQGRIQLEVEIKGPEPEAVQAVATALRGHPACLPGLEITSYETTLLERFRQALPGVPTDLLVPRSEPWMRAGVIAYQSAHRGRLAGARAVHLHASQLFPEACTYIRDQGMEVHAWGVNSLEEYNLAVSLDIPRICTDHPAQIIALQREVQR